MMPCVVFLFPCWNKNPWFSSPQITIADCLLPVCCPCNGLYYQHPNVHAHDFKVCLRMFNIHMVLYCTIPYNTLHYNTILHCHYTIHYYTMLYYAMLYYTILYYTTLQYVPARRSRSSTTSWGSWNASSAPRSHAQLGLYSAWHFSWAGQPHHVLNSAQVTPIARTSALM